MLLLSTQIAILTFTNFWYTPYHVQAANLVYVWTHTYGQALPKQHLPLATAVETELCKQAYHI